MLSNQTIYSLTIDQEVNLAERSNPMSPISCGANFGDIISVKPASKKDEFCPALNRLAMAAYIDDRAVPQGVVYVYCLATQYFK